MEIVMSKKLSQQSKHYTRQKEFWVQLTMKKPDERERDGCQGQDHWVETWNVEAPS